MNNPTPKEMFDNFNDLPPAIPHGIICTSSGNKARWIQQSEAQNEAGQVIGSGFLVQWYSIPTPEDTDDFSDRLSEVIGKSVLTFATTGVADPNGDPDEAVSEVFRQAVKAAHEIDSTLAESYGINDRSRTVPLNNSNVNAPSMRKPKGLQ